MNRRSSVPTFAGAAVGPWVLIPAALPRRRLSHQLLLDGLLDILQFEYTPRAARFLLGVFVVVHLRLVVGFVIRNNLVPPNLHVHVEQVLHNRLQQRVPQGVRRRCLHQRERGP